MITFSKEVARQEGDETDALVTSYDGSMDGGSAFGRNSNRGKKKEPGSPAGSHQGSFRNLNNSTSGRKLKQDLKVPNQRNSAADFVNDLTKLPPKTQKSNISA